MEARLLRLTVLAGLAGLGMAAGHCQQAFHFRNYVPGMLDAPVFDELGQRLYGSNHVAMLYGGLTPDDMKPARWGLLDPMPPAPFIYTPEGKAGYFWLVGYVEAGQRLGCGFPIWLQVRAWDRRVADTWEEAVALGHGYGASEPFLMEGGSTCMPDPSPPVHLIGLKSFSLVPEPSVWALLALGGLLLSWSRWCPRGFGGFATAKCCPEAVAKPARWVAASSCCAAGAAAVAALDRNLS